MLLNCKIVKGREKVNLFSERLFSFFFFQSFDQERNIAFTDIKQLANEKCEGRQGNLFPLSQQEMDFYARRFEGHDCKS